MDCSEFSLCWTNKNVWNSIFFLLYCMFCECVCLSWCAQINIDYFIFILFLFVYIFFLASTLRNQINNQEKRNILQWHNHIIISSQMNLVLFRRFYFSIFCIQNTNTFFACSSNDVLRLKLLLHGYDSKQHQFSYKQEKKIDKGKWFSLIIKKYVRFFDVIRV